MNQLTLTEAQTIAILATEIAAGLLLVVKDCNIEVGDATFCLGDEEITAPVESVVAMCQRQLGIQDSDVSAVRAKQENA